MPSHTYNRIGRWGAAVRASIDAWHSDLKADHGDGFAIYPSHNLHMLLFAASNDGQGAVAIQAARDYADLMGGANFYRVLTTLRFGRFEDNQSSCGTHRRAPSSAGCGTSVRGTPTSGWTTRGRRAGTCRG